MEILERRRELGLIQGDKLEQILYYPQLIDSISCKKISALVPLGGHSAPSSRITGGGGKDGCFVGEVQIEYVSFETAVQRLLYMSVTFKTTCTISSIKHQAFDTHPADLWREDLIRIVLDTEGMANPGSSWAMCSQRCLLLYIVVTQSNILI